jgi:hypothetical protein
MKVKQSPIHLLKSAMVFVSGVLLSTHLQALPINSVPYGSIVGNGFVDFEDLPQVAAPGLNFDAIFASNGTQFAERFVGQTLSFSGNFDVLSGAPTNPLALQAGAPSMNINVFDFDPTNGNVLTGLGPLGFPNFDAIGEGAVSILFDFDQAAFGFQLLGGDGGTGTIDFYRRDGSLISSVGVSGLANDFYGFAREGDVKDIAGISISNLDPAGIAIDNLKFTVQGVTPDSGATLALFGLSLACIILRRKFNVA